jgi:purine-nucleoside phosphorylase
MKEFEKQRFRRLFGINRKELGEVLVISPFFSPKLFKQRLKKISVFKGMVYQGINGQIQERKISFINTGMGQSLVADCVMAQDAKKVKALIFLGAAGAIRDLEIGDNTVIEKAFFDTEFYYKFGIFIDPSLNNFFLASPELISKTKNFSKECGLKLKPSTLISLHTFLDQGPERAKVFSEKKIQSVDLECALFYAAAKKKGIPAVALCFVSDHILNKPFWSDFSVLQKAKIRNQIFALSDFSLQLAGKI